MDDETERPPFGVSFEVPDIEPPFASLADAFAEMEKRLGPLPRIEGTIDFAAGTAEIHYVSAEDEARALIIEIDQSMRGSAEDWDDED